MEDINELFKILAYVFIFIALLSNVVAYRYLKSATKSNRELKPFVSRWLTNGEGMPLVITNDDYNDYRATLIERALSIASRAIYFFLLGFILLILNTI